MRTIFDDFYEAVNDVRSIFEQQFDPEAVRAELSVGDVLPNAIDNTFKGWFYRLKWWGKINITYRDTELKKKHKLTQDAFIKKIQDSTLLKLFGIFKVEKLAVNKCRFVRSFIGINGSKQEEVFEVEVDLKPEFKKILKK